MITEEELSRWESMCKRAAQYYADPTHCINDDNVWLVKQKLEHDAYLIIPRLIAEIQELRAKLTRSGR